jgi:hypothetical protein
MLLLRSSAPPITVRTGLDNNGDTVFNDRPAGYGRNSERGIGQWSSEGTELLVRLRQAHVPASRAS